MSYVLVFSIHASCKTPKLCNEVDSLQVKIAALLRAQTNITERLDKANNYRRENLRAKGFVNKAVEYRLVFHSIGLIQTAPKRKADLRMDNSKTSIPEDSLFWASVRYADSRCSNRETCRDLVNEQSLFQNINAQIRKRGNHPRIPRTDPNFEFFKAIKQADPVIKWLLQQDKNSVTNSRLLEEAVKIYDGDVLKALGVIGFIFDQERMQAHPRKHQTLLGSRLKPLFCNIKDDPYGYNYHFWAYLNLGLQGGGVPEKTFNTLFQRVYQNDKGDYWANRLGLRAGVSLRNQFHKVKSQEFYDEMNTAP